MRTTSPADAASLAHDPPSLRCLGVLATLALAACSGPAIDIGHYRIVTVSDGLFGLRCQPRNDFFHVDPSSPDAEPAYLGTCSTPRFVTEHLGLPADPSCFATSADGSSLVYFHRPQWCGAGPRAAGKPGGVYLHSRNGDRLLYPDTQVGQIWSRAALEANAIRVSWKGAQPSVSGATCAQRLIIRADGTEAPDGEAGSVHGCGAERAAGPPVATPE